MAAEIKERPRRAWVGSSDRRRDAECGHQGKRGTSNQGGPGDQVSSFPSFIARPMSMGLNFSFPCIAAICALSCLLRIFTKS